MTDTKTKSSSSKNKQDYDKDYTKPKLRAELKEKIKEDDKGGKTGQWSARKSQLLTKEYESKGGDYKHSGKLTKDQASLQEWTNKEK